MSVGRTPLEVPVSVSYPLTSLYDSVNVRQDELEAILPALDIEPAQLSSTHIHLAHQEMLGGPADRLVAGQCIKILNHPVGREQEARSAYLQYLVPGLSEEKIPETTVVAVDMAGIPIAEFLRIHGLAPGEPKPAPNEPEPTMQDLENAICREASRVLMHELLHVPIRMSSFESPEAENRHKEKEEDFIDAALEAIDAEGMPPRLVDVQVSQRLPDMGAMAMMLQSIQNHRRMVPLTS